MAFTLNQLSAIDNAIASGQLSVEYDGKKVTYRSIADLMTARSLVVSELTAAGLLGQSRLSNRGPSSLATFSRD